MQFGLRDLEVVFGPGVLLDDPDDRLFNAVATALHAGMTVDQANDLDFGYSPPFDPVWDPVLTAAKVLSDDLE